MKNESLCIGIDLGGTKIEIAVFDQMLHEIHRQRTATPAGDYAATVQAIVGLVNQAELRLNGRGAVGIGTPGAVSKVTGLFTKFQFHLLERSTPARRS